MYICVCILDKRAIKRLRGREMEIERQTGNKRGKNELTQQMSFYKAFSDGHIASNID